MAGRKHRSISSRYIPDKFIIGLFLMIFLAYLFPGLGTGEEVETLNIIIDYGIALIFFFYGLKLSPSKFQAGMRNWKLHVVVQSLTFVVFPLLVLPFFPWVEGGRYETLWLSLFFLAALPSTVSSSVVMVSIARGNVPAAIFNASLSGILGILATPLWMGIFLSAQTAGFDFSDVLFQLLLQILLPVALGLALNRYFGKWAERYNKQLSTFDKTIILLIVYKSFSRSFEGGILDRIGVYPLVVLSASVLLLFFILIFLSGRISAVLRFSREDRITAIFCGTKKSLVHGSVMSTVLFAGFPSGGIFLLPIMIYHAFQLFYISIMAGNMGNASDRVE